MLDAEGFGRPERRAHGVEALLQFGAQGVRVGRVGEVPLVGRLNATLERQAAPVAAGPGVAEVQPIGVGVRSAGHPEGAPNDNREPRHARLEHRRHRPRALADGGGLLPRGSDYEPGLIEEVHRRDMEGVAEVDEARHLLAPVGRQPAAVVVRVVGDDPHRVPIEPREPRDHGSSPAAADLEEGVAVEHHAEDFPHFVGPAPVAGDGGKQRLLAPRRVVAWLRARGLLPRVLGQIRKEPADLTEGVVLVFGQVVDHAVVVMDLRPAEVLLGDHFTHALGYHGRARDEHLRGVLHHDAPVGSDHARGPQAGHAPHGRGHDRHLVQHFNDGVPGRVGGHVGAADGFEGAHAAASAGAIDQPHDGHLQLARHLLAVALLAADGGVGGAAADGEVVATHHHPPPADAGHPPYEVRGADGDQVALLVVVSLARQGAGFGEGAGVDEPFDAFADGELAACMLALDVLFAAHLAGKLGSPVELFNFGEPGHVRGTPSWFCARIVLQPPRERGS